MYIVNVKRTTHFHCPSLFKIWRPHTGCRNKSVMDPRSVCPGAYMSPTSLLSSGVRAA